MRSFSEWQVLTDGGEDRVPNVLLGAPFPIDAADMAPELSILLPSYPGAFDCARTMPATISNCGAALFLADPNLRPVSLARLLKARGIGWVANLPSVGQHEHEFRKLLAEVDLDYPREMRVLSVLKEGGLRFVATICDPFDVEAALAIEPDAIFALPPLPFFLNGFPTLERRVDLEAAITTAAPGRPIFGLRAVGEPVEGLAGAILRPSALTP